MDSQWTLHVHTLILVQWHMDVRFTTKGQVHPGDANECSGRMKANQCA